MRQHFYPLPSLCHFCAFSPTPRPLFARRPLFRGVENRPPNFCLCVVIFTRTFEAVLCAFRRGFHPRMAYYRRRFGYRRRPFARRGYRRYSRRYGRGRYGRRRGYRRTFTTGIRTALRSEPRTRQRFFVDYSFSMTNRMFDGNAYPTGPLVAVSLPQLLLSDNKFCNYSQQYEEFYIENVRVRVKFNTGFDDQTIKVKGAQAPYMYTKIDSNGPLNVVRSQFNIANSTKYKQAEVVDGKQTYKTIPYSMFIDVTAG